MATGLLGTNPENILYGAGNSKITDDQIRNFIKSAGSTDQIYDTALQHGLSAAQIGNAMQGQAGFTQDNINNYLTSRGVTQPKPSGLLNNSMPNVNNAAGAFLDPRANIFYGQGNSGITAQDIRNRIGQGLTPDQVYNEALQHGVSAEQVYNAFGGQEGYTREAIDGFLASKGVNKNPYVVPGTQDMPVVPAKQVTETKLAEFKPAMFTGAVPDQTRGTVAGQLERVLDPNSVLMQRAAAMGLQRANSRGLLNSSLGVSAAQNAIVDAGLQIATPDAASFNQFALQNAQEQNRLSQFNAEQALRGGMFNADVLSQNARFNAQESNNMIRSQLGDAQAIRLADVENKYKYLLQNSINSANMYQNTMREIGGVMANMELKPEAKESQINSLLAIMDEANAVNSAIFNSGVGEAFGAPAQGQVSAAQIPGAAQPTGRDVINPPASQAEKAAFKDPNATTSAVTGGPVGETEQGTYVLPSGKELSSRFMNALKETYGLPNTKGIVDGTTREDRQLAIAQGTLNGYETVNGSTRPKPVSPVELEQAQATLDRYPTRQQLQEAMANERVFKLDLATRGYPIRPEFTEYVGVGNTAVLYYDPKNVLGLRA